MDASTRPLNHLASFPLPGNVHVTAPASTRLLTPFVLSEQEDWFEDEMSFIRAFIRAGMYVIDIGANYGVYTLTMAKLIGESGRLWAFEPTTSTAECLSASITNNHFGNIELVRAALSDRLGKARLFLTPNSELNSLHKASTPGTHSESITLLTLDHCRKRFNWQHIDFIKLDAEGEECNILKKAKSTLADLSPLIMFELKHGQQLNLSAIHLFKSLGYGTYRLIPALSCLVPFSVENGFDSYMLNLFCCKEDRAIQLEKDGFLVRQYPTLDQTDLARTARYFDQHAYVTPLRQLIADDAWILETDYLKVLNHYALARSMDLPMAHRCSHLSSAWKMSRDMIENGERNCARLVSLARIAFDFGERSLGMRILSEMIQRCRNPSEIEILEPLLPACSPFDGIAPRGADLEALQHWLIASVLTQYVEKHAYSSYFSGRHVLPHMQWLEQLGYLPERLTTRRRLIETCFPV